LIRQQRRRLRLTGRRLARIAVVVLLGVSGYLISGRTAEGVVGRARAAVAALGSALAAGPRPDQR
jgi:hypothetical protein